MAIQHSIRQVQWPTLVMIAAGVILALHPALWLANSWLEPAYDSNGFAVFLLVAGLFIWSVTSRAGAATSPNQKNLAIGLLLLSALIRLASQVLAINTIGALCLVVDVYALGLLFGLGNRSRRVSPFWLAVAFTFSLPLERIIQRTVGYWLQQISADGACSVLSTFFDNVVCQGVRIIISGVDVLVDLPCSGARTLLLGLLGFALAAALCRPRPLAAALGFVVVITCAWLANVARISVLAIGISDPASFGGINVMEQPWHDGIGLAALSLVCAAIALWARASWQPADVTGHSAPRTALKPRTQADTRWKPAAAAISFVLACTILALPRTAVDVARAESKISLPISLEGHARKAIPLSPRESAFFTQFGGASSKAEYGPHGLMLVKTSSPLRHLHAPDECLRGMGYDVTYLGATFGAVPTAVYRATAPDGRQYRIDVSFVSDRGEITTNVATAVWRWLQGDASSWTAVQRISPEAISPREHDIFSQAVIAALDLTPPPHPTQEEGTL